ncbi:MAG TPA: cation:proton antiporter [Candidatus Limnocylindrales bacterium]|nr:cation:proton antiporter [Candidatus Limnocylindrales bacterium]
MGLLEPGTIAGLAGSAAAATEALAALTGLFILFLAAKIGEEVARRTGQPGVVGEIAGGFLVGPYALALVVPGEVALVLAELGVVVLLFSVGLEVRVDDLVAVGRAAVATALVAMVLPLVAGAVIATATGEPAPAAAFTGLALAATSIGITSRVLAELGVLDRAYSRVVLGAAIVDDILALLAIGILSGAATGATVGSTLLLFVAAVGTLALGLAAARRLRGLRREVFTWPLFADTPLVPTFIVVLGAALLAAQLGLAGILGAFMVGLIVAETEARDELEHEMRPLGLIFTPFFFAVTGAQVDLGALLRPEVGLLALGLAAAGVLTKLGGGLIGARALGRRAAFVVGAGMVPRGEVGIIVANLGLSLGLLRVDLFSALMVAVVLTTLAAPYLLVRAIARADAPVAGPG